jgi:LuxR family transcriptional regulator, maltose regulon positive regulatory protein
MMNVLIEKVMQPPVLDLYVQTLGSFSLWRNGQQLPEQVWRRATAVRLFQYLLTNRGQYIAKERIVADLWPGLDETRADRDFKVALNALNNVLEPDRTPRAPAVFITRQQLSYGLNVTAPLRLDLFEFEEGLVKASQKEGLDPEVAIYLYQQALQLYQGDYLPDAIYEDWASAERERLSTLYLAGATRLARLLLDAGQTVEMLLWCQKVIGMDACWEEAYRLLIRAHMANGNRPMAIRVYQQCETALMKELGVEPMNQTKRLYEELL